MYTEHICNSVDLFKLVLAIITGKAPDSIKYDNTHPQPVEHIHSESLKLLAMLPFPAWHTSVLYARAAFSKETIYVQTWVNCHRDSDSSPSLGTKIHVIKGPHLLGICLTTKKCWNDGKFLTEYQRLSRIWYEYYICISYHLCIYIYIYAQYIQYVFIETTYNLPRLQNAK